MNAGSAHHAQRLFAGLPSQRLPWLGCIARPNHAPRSNSLFAAVIASLRNKVVTHVDANREWRTGGLFDPENLKLRGVHARKGSKPGVDLLQQMLAPCHRCRSELSSHHVNPEGRPHLRFFDVRKRHSLNCIVNETRPALSDHAASSSGRRSIASERIQFRTHTSL